MDGLRVQRQEDLPEAKELDGCKSGNDEHMICGRDLAPKMGDRNIPSVSAIWKHERKGIGVRGEKVCTIDRVRSEVMVDMTEAGGIPIRSMIKDS